MHAVKVSNDGLVYVADRPNRRVQVFTPDGKYVTQTFINRSGPSPQSAAGLAFSPDAQQQFLYVADYGNSHIAVLDRKSLQLLYQFGQRSEKPGDFQGLHHLAIDSKGNLYTGEVAPGARAQRFVFKGLSNTLPPNAIAPAVAPPQTAAPRAFPRTGSRRAAAIRRGPARWRIRTAMIAELAATGRHQAGRRDRHHPRRQGRHVAASPIRAADPPHRSRRAMSISRFGNGMFVQAHGFCQDRDGNFWAGDSGPFQDNPATKGRGFQLFKFSPDGKVLLSLGKAGVSKAGKAIRSSVRPRARSRRTATSSWPTVIGRGRPTPSRTATVWCGSRPTALCGANTARWAPAPGEFMGPHALAFDSQGRLFVADRSNNRVQIFDRDMQFVDEWRHFGRPSGMAILRDDTMIVADSESSQIIGGPPQAPEGGGNVMRNPGWGNGFRDRQREGRLAALLQSRARVPRAWGRTTRATSSPG